MQTRKITIYLTKSQSKKTIMSSATTLGDLKRDLTANNIDYTDMTFFEGVSKVELKNDDSILPHDVPFKGTITNELVFMLTNVENKIKSGFMSRNEIYNTIKEYNLEGAIQKEYGKNYTQCKNEDLISIISRHTANNTPCTCTKYEANSPEKAAIKRLVDILCEKGFLNIGENHDIINTLENKSIESSYSEEEIEEMFKDYM